MPLMSLQTERPPCSAAERRCAETVADELAARGLTPDVSAGPAPTSPTWVPMLRAVARVWAAAFIAADMRMVATALAVVAVAGGVPSLAAFVSSLPLLGGVTHNVVARLPGTDPAARPVVTVAHLDSHPTNGAPLKPWHRMLAGVSGWLVLVATIAGRFANWRAVAGPVAIEAIATLAWLARGELRRHHTPADDNTSGLIALVELATLARAARPVRDLWIVATGAATSGGAGITAFLRQHPGLHRAWIVEVDALGSGEVVASPIPSRFPAPGTPSQLVRGIASAAQATGDPIEVRRVRRPHSDARTALRQRALAITLTAGIRHPAREGPDAANAARVARVVYALANLPA